jgi:nitroreductase
LDVAQAIRNRRSIRSYSDRKIEKEKLRAILEAGRLAPSAYNRQEWRFVVVRNKSRLKDLARACDNQEFVAEADTLICCCATESKHIATGGERTYPLNIACAVSFMMLEAVEQELGCCWIGAYNASRIKRLLRIPEEIRVVSLLVLGYPHYTPPPTERKKLGEVFAAEHYEQPFE